MLEKELENFACQHIARCIEWIAAMARELGFAFPKDYDVGFVVKSEMVTFPGEIQFFYMQFKIRIDDTGTEYKINLPTPDDTRYAGIPDIRAASLGAVLEYVKHHPECRVKGQDAETLKSRLESVSEVALASMDAAADNATFTRR